MPGTHEDPLPVRAVGGVRFERQGTNLRTGRVDRLALLAAWSPTAVQSRSVVRLIGELQDNGYEVIVCSTSAAPGPIVMPAISDVDVDVDRLAIVRRTNRGYDFGSWSVLMELYPGLLRADKILVINDSLVGPFSSLTPAIADFESTSADVWGLVESGQIIDHLQSFFRGFRYGCLDEPVMRAFWWDMRVIDDKVQLIAEYEYGFSSMLKKWNFSTDCFVDYRGITGRRHNPTIAGWRRLLDAGVPFVKRELIRRPELVPDGAEIGPVLLERYGVHVNDWM